MYGQKSSSVPQKLLILAIELGLVAVAYAVLFGDLLAGVRWFGDDPSLPRNATLFAFDLVVFLRFLLTLFVFVKRHIPWAETMSIPFAFALYLLGFPLLAAPATVPFGALEIAGCVLFAIGSFLNTWSEHQRKRFKDRPENKGKLFTGGLFSLSMHINFFGDVLWVLGYACVAHTAGAFAIPAFLFGFFWFGNIPKLDAYLREHYGEQFTEYEKRTKRFVPFVL